LPQILQTATEIVLCSIDLHFFSNFRSEKDTGKDNISENNCQHKKKRDLAEGGLG